MIGLLNRWLYGWLGLGHGGWIPGWMDGWINELLMVRWMIGWMYSLPVGWLWVSD